MNSSSMASPSTANSQTTTLGRIVANVVDMQQQLQNQFLNIQTTMESLRLEQRTTAQNLREDLRRTDDRAQKQVDELRIQHAKEVERLTDIIKTLLAKETTVKVVEQPVQARPAQQTYQAGQPATSFFGPMPGANNDMQLRQAYYMQQEQQLRQMMQQQQMAATPMPTPGGITTGAPMSPVLNKAVMPTLPQQQQPSLVQSQLLTPPKPSAGTVTLPISAPAEVPKPKSEVKEVVLPAAPPAVVPATTTGGFFNKPASPLPTAPKSLFGQPTAPIFGTPKAPEKKEEAAPKQPTPAKKDEEEEHVEEYEPQVDFAPVIPLPELVDVKTGEEDEEVLFEERCKLFRYAETKEWKERGIGTIKILKNPKTGTYRVVMRREQVHKLCANFTLTKGMTISKMGKNEKALLWLCIDFAEGEQTTEQLSAKFATVEIADEFKKIFTEGADNATATPTKPDVAAKKDEKKKVPEEKKTKEKAPEEPKTTGFGDQFKKKEGEWDCADCYARNKGDATACLCCGTNKDGSKGTGHIFSKPIGAPVAQSKFSFGQSAGAATTAAPKFSFGLPAKDAAPAATKEGEKPKFSFGAAAAAAAKEEAPVNTPQKAAGLFGSSTATPKFSFGAAPAAGSPSTSIFGGSKPADGKPTTATSFSFAKKEETPSTSSPVSFSFKSPATPAGTTPGKSLFGQSAAEKTAEGGATTSRIFGAGLTGGSSGNAFAEAAKTSSTSIFNEDARKKAEEQFASQKKSVFGASAAKKEEKENDDEDHEGDEEYEPQVDFAPVVPLPDLVEVRTGEEGEEVMFKHRAKLYRFDRDNKEWKERGTGDIKILKNPDSGKCRVVMRREQVHKLCANFAILPAIDLKQKPGAPNVFNWICKDYAEDTNGSDEMFSVKFKTEETGQQFRDAFVQAQED